MEINNCSRNPKVILLISGKRKSGKDYVAEKLKSKLGNECTILRISEPIKKYYAEKCEISLKELLSDGPFKEKYRQDMIIWSDQMRSKQPEYFCKIACENASRTPIWIVSDIRRKTDINYFKQTYGSKIKTLRISASESERKQRGWIFTKGVDDGASECNLDDFNVWDLKITNDKEGLDNFEKILEILRV